MSAKRQQLVETAIALFGLDGFHATGIDKIAEVAGVSKKTLYHHFRSKEELILAALKHHDGLFRNHFMKSVEHQSSDPKKRLLGIFNVAQAWFSENTFNGCIFINAIGEYSATDSEIREACKDYKRQIVKFIEELARDAQLNNPKQVAEALSLLLEGSIVTAQVAGSAESAETARNAASLIINASIQE